MQNRGKSGKCERFFDADLYNRVTSPDGVHSMVTKEAETRQGCKQQRDNAPSPGATYRIPRSVDETRIQHKAWIGKFH